jgi:hypothetical protein
MEGSEDDGAKTTAFIYRRLLTTDTNHFIGLFHKTGSGRQLL